MCVLEQLRTCIRLFKFNSGSRDGHVYLINEPHHEKTCCCFFIFENKDADQLRSNYTAQLFSAFVFAT